MAQRSSLLTATARIAGALALLVAAAVPACTCQRQENIEAKARLSAPAPPDAHLKAAEDKLDASGLGTASDAERTLTRRILRMEGAEVAARLGSFAFTSVGELAFTRGEAARGTAIGSVHSMEKTRLEQSEAGDFAIETKTGDGGEMRVAYVNEVFFLKNNNGKWRLSRDPRGERNVYRTEAMAVWRSFYELLEHAIVVEKTGEGTFAGRSVVKYRLSMPDESAQARTEGQKVPVENPARPVVDFHDGVDAGVLDGGSLPDLTLLADPPEEAPAARNKRIGGRMAAWRQRAHPAGGKGELAVDAATGVVLNVKFQGGAIVADGPEPARLDVKIDASITEIGKPREVAMPKDAIDEVVRQKMPVRPRELLEEANIVPPLPRDAGPAGSRRNQPLRQDAPDDDEDAP